MSFEEKNNRCLKPPMMMKLKRKKFSELRRTRSDPYDAKTKVKQKSYCHGDELCKRQMINPFQSTKKSQNLLDLKEVGSTESNSMFSLLSKPRNKKGGIEKAYELPSFKSGSQTSEVNLEDSETKGQTMLPLDWSIKTSFKLSSTGSFKWCTTLKPSEEAKCTASMVGSASIGGEFSDKEKMRCALSYWCHPNIPWLKLFPRDRPSVSKSECTLLKQEALAALSNKWSAAFESLFGLLKAGHCPYFYLCSHQTTVFFRREDDKTIADMVPTTYGVRTTLKQEDIDFTMPLAQDLMETESAEQENLDDNEETGDAREFLDSLGIDSQRYSELDPSMVKIRAASRMKLDHSVRSLVRVKGSHVNGLFNYLLNNRSLTPTVGELTGVPPTLLSPSVFVGGSIQHNHVKCGISQARQGDGSMANGHFLHLTGPLLPHAVQAVNSILSSSQAGYTGKFETLQNSSAYNASDQDPPKLDIPSAAAPSLSDPSVNQDEIQKKPIGKSDTCTLYEVELRDGLFTFK